MCIVSDSSLVTLYVKSLYTNIPNNQGIKAVREAYNNYPIKALATNVIAMFLSLILTQHNFVFNSIIFLQIMGYAMGTVCVPGNANITTGQFEKQHIYLFIQNKSIHYFLYIDYIFMIWTGNKQGQLVFLEDFNNKHKTIKFEHSISHSNVSVLNTLIYKIQTTLFRKLSTEN